MDVAYLKRQTEAILAEPVADLTIIPLDGDASTRRYSRIMSNLPRTLVLMELGPGGDAQGQLFCKQQELFAQAGLPVPTIYHYEAEKGLIFLEDCGDITLQEFIKQYGITACYIYYKQAIDHLLKLQAATSVLPKTYPAYGWAFDIPKFTYELDFFATHMLQLRDAQLSSQQREQLNCYFNQLAQILAQEPLYLTHRDYHSRNLMVIGNELKILDFQDARLGLCQYDLASLLRDSYVALPEDMIEELLAYYLAQRKTWGLPELEKENFERMFAYTCIQRNLKALGTFAYQTAVRKNQVYMQYIPQTLGYLRINLSRYPEWDGLRKLLEQFLPELT